MEKVDRSAEKALLLEIKRKNSITFITEFQRDHRGWMQRLANAYKERGRFGIHLFSIADHYSDMEDKEVALFASLMLAENDSLLLQQQELYNIIGDSPYKNFLCNRRFVELSRGDSQKKLIPKSWTQYHEISNIFSIIYDICAEFGCMEAYIHDYLRNHPYTDPFMALADTFKYAKVTKRKYKLNLLLLILAGTDGMGMGKWHFDGYKLLCPEGKEIIEFLELWFPDFWECGLTFDKAVEAMGLQEPTDLYYAYRGFEALKKVNAVEVRQYCRRYSKHYNDRKSSRLYDLKNMQPKIFFEIK